MGLSKHRRLRRREEFRRVLKDGKRARDHLLSITAVDAQNNDAETRYGFAIPKRVGSAVTRNRIKRRLRAIADRADHPRGWDYVIYAYPAAANSNSQDLSESVNRLVKRLSRKPRRSR